MRVKVTAIVSFFLGLGLLIFSALGVILNWKGNFIPFLALSLLLLVVSYFFFKEFQKEEEEISKSEEERGGDDSEEV